MKRGIVMQDVGVLRETVLRGRDDEIPVGRRGPGATDMNESRPIAFFSHRASLDISRDRFVFAPGGDHEVGPRGTERGRPFLYDAHEMGAPGQVHELFIGLKLEVLFFEGPA